ncbi:MAG: hypothetical protein J0I41_18545 [Filimonas sp.]|nr:hypothetical protein [Filimonas sp.]
MNRKTRGYVIVSLALSAISLILSAVINIRIAQHYFATTGKTRALFGLIELFHFGYQYYVSFIGIGALIFALIAFRRQTNKWRASIIILVSLFAIGVVFIRPWHFFV